MDTSLMDYFDVELYSASQNEIAIGAKITLSLIDGTKEDAPAKVVAQRVLQPSFPHVLPIKMVLFYATRKLKHSKRYALTCRIEEQGRLLYITDLIYPVVPGCNELQRLYLAPLHCPT